MGLCAALIAATIWIVVGILALAAAPLCTECMQSWLPPVALGALGSLGPLLLWSIALIVAWRHWSLLAWSLVGWPILGAGKRPGHRVVRVPAQQLSSRTSRSPVPARVRPAGSEGR